MALYYVCIRIFLVGMLTLPTVSLFNPFIHEQWRWNESFHLRADLIDRRLVSATDTDDFDGSSCVLCQDEDVSKCGILEGMLMEDVYFPDNPDFRGICKVLESRAERLDDIFGPDRTFRDSEQCRTMVYEYLCLFWGSDNAMYINRCKDYQVFTGQTTTSRVIAFQPCRRFCVQLAEICANNIEWIQTCSNIPCCTSDQIDEGCVREGDNCIPYPGYSMTTVVDDGDDEEQSITIDDDVIRTASLGACQLPTVVNIVSAGVRCSLTAIISIISIVFFLIMP